MCLTFSVTLKTGSSVVWASLVSRVNISSDRCCTVALSWYILSLVTFPIFSTSTFISLVICLFPYPELSIWKYAQHHPNAKQKNHSTNEWMNELINDESVHRTAPAKHRGLKKTLYTLKILNFSYFTLLTIQCIMHTPYKALYLHTATLLYWDIWRLQAIHLCTRLFIKCLTCLL